MYEILLDTSDVFDFRLASSITEGGALDLMTSSVTWMNEMATWRIKLRAKVMNWIWIGVSQGESIERETQSADHKKKVNEWITEKFKQHQQQQQQQKWLRSETKEGRIYWPRGAFEY